jgi:hypothetical protein
MKEPHKQGIANQFGRESCAGSREGTGEALTAGNPGQALSSEITTLRVPTLSCQGEGHTRRGKQLFLLWIREKGLRQLSVPLSVPRKFLIETAEVGVGV